MTYGRSVYSVILCGIATMTSDASVVTALSRERVRRAEIALELIAREMPDAVMSAAGASDSALVAPAEEMAMVPDGDYRWAGAHLEPVISGRGLIPEESPQEH